MVVKCMQDMRRIQGQVLQPEELQNAIVDKEILKLEVEAIGN